MADRTQTFTTRIFLNDDQAKNKIRELEKSISTIRADMAKAADAGDWSKFNSLKKDLNQSTKELNSMRTTAQSVEHVLNNLGSSSIKEIKRTISAINKELASGSVARNSQEWKFLTEQLGKTKNELQQIAVYYQQSIISENNSGHCQHDHRETNRKLYHLIPEISQRTACHSDCFSCNTCGN